MVKGILDHNYEIAIVARVPYPETIEKIPLITEEIVLITSPQSNLASKRRLFTSGTLRISDDLQGKKVCHAADGLE